MRNITAAAATAALVATVLFVTSSAIPAATKHTKKKPAPSASAGLVAKGKSLSARCAGCHNADLGGRPGFTPSVHANGALKQYNATTFARFMDKGLDEEGKPVKKMPVQHLSAADSKALYAYLKTLK